MMLSYICYIIPSEKDLSNGLLQMDEQTVPKTDKTTLSNSC